MKVLDLYSVNVLFCLQSLSIYNCACCVKRQSWSGSSIRLNAPVEPIVKKTSAISLGSREVCGTFEMGTRGVVVIYIVLYHRQPKDASTANQKDGRRPS